MMKELRPSLIRAPLTLLLAFTLLLGVVYPFTVTMMAQIFFDHKSEGGMVERGGKVVGSRWIGQEFQRSDYFWSRPSAATPPYNAMGSAASNFSLGNPKWLEAVNARIAQLQKADPGNKNLIPIDLVTYSASGVDPHISVAAAEYQLPRVARARGFSEESVQELLDNIAERRQFGILGEARVDVLLLNVALDEASHAKGSK